MKIFKKFLAAIIAAVMALGIFAFAACGNDNSGNNNGPDEGGNEGGNNNGTVLTTAQLLQAVSAQQVKYLEVNASSSSSVVDPAMVISETNFNAKVNLNDLDADIAIYSAILDEQQNLVKDYDYSFVRGGYNFSDVSYAGIPKEEVSPENYSSIPLVYNSESSIDSSMSAYVPLGLNQANYALISFVSTANALTIESGKATVDLNKAVYNVVQDLKEVVNGLTEETTLGDILANEKVRKYLTVFTELVPATLVSAGVAKLPELLEMLNSLTPEDASEFGEMGTFVLMAQAILNGVSFDDLAQITPDGTVTYDYLIKLLASDAMRDIANTVLVNLMTVMGGGNGGDAEQVSALADGEGEVEGLLPNLTNISVGLILDMVNAGKPDADKLDLETLKTNFAAMTDSVTEEGFYFAMPKIGSSEGSNPDDGTVMQEAGEDEAPTLMYVSGAKIEYALSGASVTGISFELNVTTNAGDMEIVSEYSASITYTSEAYRLADISNNTVWYMPWDYDTGTTVSFHQYNEIRDESERYGGAWITYTVDFVDGVADPDTLKVYAVDFNDPVRYKLDPATEIQANPDGSYTIKTYAYKLDGENNIIYDDDTGTPVCDKTKTKDVTFTFEITSGGIVTQEYLDSLGYQPGWDCIGELYVEATLNSESDDRWIGGQLSGKVSDLLAHIEAQAA
ncbi:MAG: hypothetical protein K2N33_01470 [Clostridia bacterium]|nr:hypothetical protein [Clostridia bacterium]